jgi:hypothetical protein
MSETPLEQQLRSILAEEAGELRVGEAPYGAILHEGRIARRRSRAALGAGMAVLVALPGVTLAGATLLQDRDASGTGQTGPAAGPTAPTDEHGDPEPDPNPVDEYDPADGTGTGPEVEAEKGGTTGQDPADPGGPGDPEPDQPLPPSDPGRQLLDGITLEEARAQLLSCVQQHNDPAEDEKPPMEQPDVDPADLQILLAWQGHGGENQGPGPIRRVLAASVTGEMHVRMVCSRSMGETDAGSGLSVGFHPWPLQQPEPIGTIYGRYHTPEEGLNGDWSSELPFRWVLFDTVDDSVARVTVEYAGETQEALLDGGFYITAGIIETPPTALPTVLGYDADGELIYDSRNDPGAR